MKRRIGDSIETTGFAKTVEMCFATGPLGLRKYSVSMRFVISKEERKSETISN